MDLPVSISLAHWMYLLGVLVIIVTMIFRANVLVPSIIATVLVVGAWTGSPLDALGSIFGASFVAAKELFNIFLVIALMTALLNALKDLRSDILMVEPFRAVMKNGHLAYLVLALVTYLISLFFWPTPAVPLVCAVLLPAAIAAGLPPLMGAAAIAIAGQGMALSSDYVISVAPGISAKAAGVATHLVADRALVLSVVTGLIALTLVYLRHRHDIQQPQAALLTRWLSSSDTPVESTPEIHEGSAHKAEIAEGTRRDAPLVSDSDFSKELHAVPAATLPWARAFAWLAPLAFLAIIGLMAGSRMGLQLPDLKGGAAASLVGGTAALLMILATQAYHGPRKMLESAADHITEGFVFAFKAMGSVLPIAGFFFLGASETAAAIMGTAADHTPSFLFDLVRSGQDWIPHSRVLVGLGVLIVGMVTGIDGSGFSGLPLTGALSGALAPASGVDAATLAAIGQMGAIWTGGGTLIAWSSLIAVAGFARVPVLEAVRVLTIPVLTGLATSTLLAVTFLF